MKWVIIFLPAFFVFSCNMGNQSADTSKDSSFPIEPGMEDKDTSAITSNRSTDNWDGCYWKILQRDTFALHLEQSGTDVTGKLSFNNYQKDKSSGTVYGKIDGEVLRLWYSFQSEGMNSVMEVYFRKQNSELVRGLGPMEVKGDTAYFNNKQEIEYKADQAFTKVDCSQVPGKYR
jgi:hypothetical protein